MNPYNIQVLASFQGADRLRQPEHARLGRQVRAARGPRRRLVAGWKLQWLSPWFSQPRGPRTA